MEIGTGSPEPLKVVVDGKIRFVIDPDGTFHWYCAHAHDPKEPGSCGCTAEMDCEGVLHGHLHGLLDGEVHGTLVGQMVGEAILTALNLNRPVQMTVGPRGDAQVTPNKPEGYVVLNVGGGEYVMPFYKKA